MFLSLPKEVFVVHLTFISTDTVAAGHPPFILIKLQSYHVFPDICSLQRESGSCDGYEIKWYYDSSRKVCGRFVYTGCEGNGNRFDDWDTCKMRCEKDDTDEPFVPRTTPARRRTTMRTDMTESTSLNPPTTPDMTTPDFTTPGITR